MCQELWGPNQEGQAWRGCSAGTLLPMARSGGLPPMGRHFNHQFTALNTSVTVRKNPTWEDIKNPFHADKHRIHWSDSSNVTFSRRLTPATCLQPEATLDTSVPALASRNLVTPELLLKTIKCLNILEKVQMLTYFETKEVHLWFKGHWSIFRKHLYI